MSLPTPQEANRPFKWGRRFRFSWKIDLSMAGSWDKTTEVHQPELALASDRAMPQIQIYIFLAIRTWVTRSILVFKTRIWPPYMAGNSLLVLWTRYYLVQGCAVNIQGTKQKFPKKACSVYPPVSRPMKCLPKRWHRYKTLHGLKGTQDKDTEKKYIED